MKKVYINIICFVIATCLGCLSGVSYASTDNENKNNQEFSYASVKYNGFDSVIDNADIIFNGVVSKIEKHNEYDEYEVYVNETLKGECEKITYVRNYHINYSDISGNVSGITHLAYEVGSSYVFMLQHIRNVYQDYYAILQDTYIPMYEESEWSVYSQKIACNDITDYIKTHKNNQSVDNLSIKFTDSDSKEVIMEEADCIVELIPIEKLRTTDIVEVYICEVSQVVKGNNKVYKDTQIIVPFFKNTIDKNIGYVVCLNGDITQSLLFTLSSKNSVYILE